MDRDDKIKEEIEKTLDAHGRMETLEANPFLFTRLKEEIEKPAGKKRKRSAVLKPAALALFILLNAFTSYYIINSENQSTVSRKTYLSAISSEYNINQTYDSQLNKLMGE